MAIYSLSNGVEKQDVIINDEYENEFQPKYKNRKSKWALVQWSASVGDWAYVNGYDS